MVGYWTHLFNLDVVDVIDMISIPLVKNVVFNLDVIDMISISFS